MVEIELAGPGWRTVRMDAAGAPALQRLLERCADFAILGTGEPPGPDDAHALLEDAPPGHPLEEKVVLGLVDAADADALFGVVDLVRGYPGPGDWYLGLLMLVPERRGAGLGASVCEALCAELARRGARRLLLGVLEHNAGARRFWAREGFVEQRRVGPRREGRRESFVLELARGL